MAKSTRPTANKRAREKARIDRQKEKERRRVEVREKRALAPARGEGEDPFDQPIPAEQAHEHDERAPRRGEHQKADEDTDDALEQD